MFCQYCGKALVDHARFCMYCGKPTVNAPVVPKQPQQPVQPRVQPAPQQPVYAPPVQQNYVQPQQVYAQQPAQQVKVQPAPQQSAPVQPVQNQPQQPAQQSVTRKLYLNTDGITAFNYKFEIRDEAGGLHYTAATVTESMVSYTARLYHPNQAEVLTVRQQKKLTFTAMNFDIVTPNGTLITDVIQKNKLSKYVYELTGLGITVDGDFFGHDFAYYRGGQMIARLHKKWMTWGDCYELEYIDPSLETVFLGSILVFEMVLSAHRRRR